MANNTDTTFQQSIGTNVDCPKCKDTGWQIYEDEQGYEMARECPCVVTKRQQARYKNAMIPEEYEDYNFKNFEVRQPVHQLMLDKLTEYLKGFPAEKKEREFVKGPSFGFIATYGEQRIKNIVEAPVRADMKRQHNNYGIGKSHLTISAAKYLLKAGYRVQVVSDPVFIQDLMTAKFNNDQGATFNKILSGITEYADFVVWDDLGKLKWTEPREDLYYQIFNELYKQGKPVLFSSNEDIETLADKIGQAAASRLKGMCKGFLYPVEGKDQR
jgi:DNA replication protein DnaC